MSQPGGHFGIDGRGSDSPAEADPVPTPTYPHCSRCQADLTHCFLSARYCPRCGWTLGAVPQEAPTPALATALAPPPLPLSVPAIEPREAGNTHSLILGYANAMFRLGWHYENGGACRNSQEAVRCYFKAAKLGNLPALTRLLGGGAGETALAGPPDSDTSR